VRKESLKKFSQKKGDSNPYRCDNGAALLPNELSSQLGAGVRVSV